MSNSNKPEKVLRVALRRIQKGWTKGSWKLRKKKGEVTAVCLEGAIFGYDSRNDKNPVCKVAANLVTDIIKERYVNPNSGYPFRSIVEFNDHESTTLEQAEEVLKLALIRAETDGILVDD